jgi:hypothetical protein
LSDDLANASSLHDWRFLQSRRKPLGFTLVDVHASEFLAVTVINGHAKLMMFAAVMPGNIPNPFR